MKKFTELQNLLASTSGDFQNRLKIIDKNLKTGREMKLFAEFLGLDTKEIGLSKVKEQIILACSKSESSEKIEKIENFLRDHPPGSKVRDICASLSFVYETLGMKVPMSLL